MDCGHIFKDPGNKNVADLDTRRLGPGGDFQRGEGLIRPW